MGLGMASYLVKAGCSAMSSKSCAQPQRKPEISLKSLDEVGSISKNFGKFLCTPQKMPNIRFSLLQQLHNSSTVYKCIGTSFNHMYSPQFAA